METGYDLLFFWVARMILMTTYATGQIPFKTVYFHGLIRTKDGKKMSKSDPSTMIDPLDIIPKYGADALRLSMIVGQAPGNDSRLYDEKIAGYRNFVNKLWNATRFVLLQCEQAGIDPKKITKLPEASELSLADRALMHAFEDLVQDVTASLDGYRLSEAGDRLYSFVWDYFCDWYLELSKGQANHAVLVHALRRILRLLHPFTPFVTEELWSHVKADDMEIIMKEQWPKTRAERKDPQAFADLQIVIDVISAIRKLRTDQEVEKGKKVTVALVTAKHGEVLQSQVDHITRMGGIEALAIVSKPIETKNIASVFLPDLEVHMSLEGLIDVEKEKVRLTAEVVNLEKFAAGIRAKLGNESFVSRAPAALVDEQKAKLAETEERLLKIGERLKTLS